MVCSGSLNRQMHCRQVFIHQSTVSGSNPSQIILIANKRASTSAFYLHFLWTNPCSNLSPFKEVSKLVLKIYYNCQFRHPRKMKRLNSESIQHTVSKLWVLVKSDGTWSFQSFLRKMVVIVTTFMLGQAVFLNQDIFFEPHPKHGVLNCLTADPFCRLQLIGIQCLLKPKMSQNIFWLIRICSWGRQELFRINSPAVCLAHILFLSGCLY